MGEREMIYEEDNIMRKEGRTAFCVECRKITPYEIKKVAEKEIIKDKEYNFIFTRAYCKECGEEMNIHGLLDLNNQERSEQYRKAEGIISIEEIKKLMELYNIGKAPLSLALGFGEITISRYLEGKIPSAKYSTIMLKALSDPEYMGYLLNENKDKMGEAAYKKSMKAIQELKKLFNVSDKMLKTLSYIFEEVQEITPLALQKILYYIQGMNMAVFKKPFFEEDCVAWQHGPVYEQVYYLFRDFKYNPIEDNRFVIFNGKSKTLSDDEKGIIDLILSTFGNYSGKVLETITHNEDPWKNARTGYNDDEPSNIIIEKESIASYFDKIFKEYEMSTDDGINKYIKSMLK